MSKMARRMMVLAAIAVMAVGCGDDDGDDGDPVDAGTDMTTPPVDMGGVDMFMEDEDMFVADEDMGPDDEDMGPDETDMFVGDGGLPGGGSATSTQIQAVIDATDGDVTLMIDDAIVTYTKDAVGDDLDGAGFFVQAEQSGPALYVAVDPTSLTPEPAVGDVVDFQVTTKGEDGNIPFAGAIDSWNVDSSGADVTFLVQDVTAVDLVTDIDDYTSELISITDATIADSFGGAGTGFSAAQITTTGVATATSDLRFRVPDDVRTGSGLGEGCVVDIGPSPLWRFFSAVQPSAWDAADFSISSCPAPETGDLVINEIGYTFAGSDDDLEFIEIYNPTGGGYDISDCVLADDNGPADADALTIPSDTLLGAGDYFVIAGSSSEITGDLVLPADLGFGGDDAVSLTCPGDVQIDIVDYDGTFPSMEDVSTQLNPGIDATGNDDATNWCLTPAGNTYGTMDRLGTPGAENLPCPCPVASSVVINEVDYDDDGTDDHGFLELYNPTGSAVDVTGWTVAFYSESDNEQDGSVVLTGSIPAGGYLVVINSGSDTTPADATITSGGFQNSTEAIALFDGVPGVGALVDVVVYEGTFGSPDLLDSTGTTTVATIPSELNVSIGSDSGMGPEPDLNSLQRVSDGCDRMNPATDWTFGTSTPGAAN